MSEHENGWHIRSDSHMEAWHVYQKINHMKVGMALDNGDLITFVRLCDGVETDERRYVPLRHMTETMLRIFALEDENGKLRDYAYALEECRRESHYCEFCQHFSWDFERCSFDFDALRAAAGMEVKKWCGMM